MLLISWKKAVGKLKIPAAFLLLSVPVFSQEKINIGIFTGSKVSQVLLAPTSEVYIVSNGDSIITLMNRNDALSVTCQNDSVQLKNILSGLLGSYKEVKISPLAGHSTLKIKPVNHDKKEMICDDDIIIFTNKKSLQVVNHVDIDNYVAGVVEAESGTSAPKEYFKIQAIMCRTFALENRGKHNNDGYDLCSDVHCQVFKGRNNKNPEIKLAVAATSGIVLADENNKLIFSAYHSNCGGQTDYSENVWRSEKEYLKPVIDSFCVNARNARWEHTLPLHEWEKYLVKEGTNSKPADSLYCFYQENRKANYDLYESKIQLTEMRKDLKLRSAFFDIEQDGDAVIFTGRGSGHGVGLCQQGAIEMARKGYSYRQIFGYYYKNVKLINYSQLK